MRKKIAMTALWLAALVCCLLLADKMMRRDDAERKYGAFFEDKQGFDVLFMGTSRVLDAVQPMELWRDFGVTSYNMGNNSECLEMTEWVLKKAFAKDFVAAISIIAAFRFFMTFLRLPIIPATSFWNLSITRWMKNRSTPFRNVRNVTPITQLLSV